MISENEILEALQAALAADPVAADATDALGVDEWSARLRVGVLNTRQMIRAGLEAGFIECVRRQRKGIDGRKRSVPAYRLKNGTP